MFIISDLHIGDGGSRDNFSYGGKKKKLFSFLDYVKGSKEYLLINGDLFDLWQMNVGSILNNNEDLINKLCELNFGYIIGNHDIDLFPLVNSNIIKDNKFFSHMILPFINIINGKKYKFFHSHEVDAFNDELNPSWGRMLSIFAGIVEEENGSPVDKKNRFIEIRMQSFGEKILNMWYYLSRIFHPKLYVPNPKNHLSTKQTNNRYLLEHFNAVKQEIDIAKCDVAIVGHTHIVGKKENWYYNSGSWSEKMNNFLHINENTGEIKFFNWDDNPIEIFQEL